MSRSRTVPSLATRLGLLIAGVAVGMVGVATIVYCYAFASMVDPTLDVSRRLATIIGKMFLSPLVVVVAFSGVLVCAGLGMCMLAFSRQARARFTSERGVVLAVVAGLVLLASFVAVLMLL